MACIRPSIGQQDRANESKWLTHSHRFLLADCPKKSLDAATSGAGSQRLSRFCVGLLPLRHSFCTARGLRFAHEGVGSRVGGVVVAAWRGTRAGRRASLARTRTEQLLSGPYPAEQLLPGFAAD